MARTIKSRQNDSVYESVVRHQASERFSQVDPRHSDYSGRNND